ncbi:MAG: P-loop NTPase fold protein [Bacteroidota bacterium]
MWDYEQIKDLEDPTQVKSKVEALDALSEQQSQLFQDLSTTREQLQEAWAEHKKAVTEEKRIQEELDTLSKNREAHQKHLNSLLVQDIYEKVKADSKLNEFIQEGKKKLLIDNDIDPGSIEEIQKAIDEQLATRNRFHELWNFFKTDLKKPRSRFLFAVYVVLGLFLIFVLPWILRNTKVLSVAQEFLIGFTTLIAAGVTAFNKFFKSVNPHLKRINEGLSFLEAAKDRFKNQEKIERELLDKEIEAVRREYERAVETEKAAREKLQQARKKVDAVEVEMQAIRKGKRLASFIEKRLTSNDYQQYLGLISLIRNDFDKLSTYLQDLALQASEEKKVERIVLYIDDLDRCPPEKVVDVLQAIHLILAFPLFVIVVGVDVRWITKSLIRRYGFMISQYDSNGRKTELPAFYRDGATPYSYLEKIFQIPFRLKPLDDSGKSKMIRHLLKKDIEEMTLEEQLPIEPAKIVDEVKETPPPEDKERLEVTEPNVGNTPPDSDKQPITEPTEPKEEKESFNPDATNQEENAGPPEPEETVYTLPDAKRLKVGAAEMQFIEQLLPILGDSPRAVKRFVNVFRLVKSNTKLNQINLPETTIYEGVLSLLAIIIGAPACAKLFFENLETTNEQTLAQVIQNMHVSDDVEEPERAREELDHLKAYFKTEGNITIDRIKNLIPEDLMEMAPLIVRFSFRVS